MSRQDEVTKAVRVKGPKDSMTALMARINAGRPKGAKARALSDFEVVRSTKRIPSQVKYVLSTGIDAYDEPTGIGGLPMGRLVELYGTDGSCKSAMAQRCAARMQQRHIYERVREDEVVVLKRISEDCPVFTIYIDNEQAMDDDAKLTVDGVQLDMMVARCDTINQMFKIMDVAITGVEELARDSEIPHFVLVICDTLAGTSSEEEMTQAWGKVDYPRQAQQLRSGFRTMMRKLTRQNVLVIATNQVGEKFEKQVQKGKSLLPQDADFNTFGGRACKFFASMRIFHTVANPNYKLDRAQKFPSGRSIEFHVVKNRLGKPGRKGRMVLLYEGGLNNIFSTLDTLLFLKLAEYGDAESGDKSIKFKFTKHGVTTTTFPPPEKGTRETSPQIEALHEWPAFYEAHKPDFELLWQKARDIMFKEAVHTPDEDDDANAEASEVDIAED